MKLSQKKLLSLISNSTYVEFYNNLKSSVDKDKFISDCFAYGYVWTASFFDNKENYESKKNPDYKGYFGFLDKKVKGNYYPNKADDGKKYKYMILHKLVLLSEVKKDFKDKQIETIFTIIKLHKDLKIDYFDAISIDIYNAIATFFKKEGSLPDENEIRNFVITGIGNVKSFNNCIDEVKYFLKENDFKYSELSYCVNDTIKNTNWMK